MGAAAVPVGGSGGVRREPFHASGAPVGAPLACNKTPAPTARYFYPPSAGPGFRYEGRPAALSVFVIRRICV